MTDSHVCFICGKTLNPKQKTYYCSACIGKKEQHIKEGIQKLYKLKEALFKVKDHFYGDFKHNSSLEKVPEPRYWIQKAIICLEKGIKEAKVIEINSL